MNSPNHRRESIELRMVVTCAKNIRFSLNLALERLNSTTFRHIKQSFYEFPVSNFTRIEENYDHHFQTFPHECQRYRNLLWNNICADEANLVDLSQRPKQNHHYHHRSSLHPSPIQYFQNKSESHPQALMWKWHLEIRAIRIKCNFHPVDFRLILLERRKF